MFRIYIKKAQSTVEYLALIMFILGAFLVFQKYIIRSFAGHWRNTGDAIGSGRLYDPQMTLECAYDSQYTNSWYGAVCFENNCIGRCYTTAATPAGCQSCIEI